MGVAGAGSRDPHVAREAIARKTRRSAGKDGRSEYLHPNRPVLRKRLFCQTNLLQALPAGAIASPPFIAASLIGLKGVLIPKVQVQAPSRRHALITPEAKRPLKSGLPAVIESSSTDMSDAEAASAT